MEGHYRFEGGERVSVVTITVPGKVRGKARPRVTKFGVYTPKKTREYERKIAEKYRETGCEPFSGEVSVEVTTYREMPKSRPKKALSEPDTYKPDVDNIGKAVLDALNGVAYMDDKQVTLLVVRKMPRTRGGERLVVTVEELE